MKSCRNRRLDAESHIDPVGSGIASRPKGHTIPGSRIGKTERRGPQAASLRLTHYRTFAWMPVNIVGGLCWGWLASCDWFPRLGDHTGPKISTWLLITGALGVSVVLASVATITQSGLIGAASSASYAIDKTVASSLAQMADALSVMIDQYMPAYRHQLGLDPHWPAVLLVNFCRFLPDKILTVMLAILFIRTVFPVSWQLLMHNRPLPAQVLCLPRQPLVFWLLFTAVTVGHWSDTFAVEAWYQNKLYYLTMYALLFVVPIACTIVAHRDSRLSNEELLGENKRAHCYQEMEEQRRQIRERFDKKGVVFVLLIVLFITSVVHGLTFLGNPNAAVNGTERGATGLLSLVFVLIMCLHLTEVAGEQQVLLGLQPSPPNDSSTASDDVEKGVAVDQTTAPLPAQAILPNSEPAKTQLPASQSP